jgi:uncharacterized protein YjiK
MVAKFLSICLAMLAFLGAVLSSGCSSPAANSSNPFDILLPYQQIDRFDLADFREPSGLVFHPTRNTLFVIGDEGDIAELQLDGTLVKQATIKKEDFEGITCDPATGLLYAVSERKAEIFEINPEDFRIVREFSIEPVFEGRKILIEDKNKVEAITFVPEADHPEGGRFYLNNESIGLNSETESVVFTVDVPLKNGSGGQLVGQITGYFTVPVTDLADFHYDPATDHLYLISDDTNTLFEATKTGTGVNGYALPGEHQEGLTVDQEGLLYIAEDSGGIVKFKSKHVNQRG